MASRQSEHFGTDWNTEMSSDGKYVTWAAVERILLQELRSEMKQMNSSLNVIRHFFHQPGMTIAISEVLRREQVKARRHRMRQAAARRRAREKKRRASTT